MMVLGPGLLNAIVAIGIGNIPGFARMTRGQVLSVKEEDYIEVTQSLGAGKWRILFKHILPNCIEPTYPAWKAGVLPLNYTRMIKTCKSMEHLELFHRFLQLGVTGFEPATPWSQTRYSSQTEPHPEKFTLIYLINFLAHRVLYLRQALMSRAF